jgi:hypothetical protein
MSAGPIDPDLAFDRWQHDYAGNAGYVTRSQALARKHGWQSGPDMETNGKNGRVMPKKQR